MPELTQLDLSHAAMMDAEENDALRLAFYERVSDTELFLLLSAEPTADVVEPRTFPVEGETYVVVFDREERLAEFAGDTVPYVALSGRAIVNMLRGQGIGIGVNLGVAPSSILIPSDAVSWLAATVEHGPEIGTDTPVRVSSPHQVPQAVLVSLNTKLAIMGGLASAAYLVAVEYESGQQGHLLGFVDAVEGAQGPLSKAMAEALIFSGVEAGQIDVSFFQKHDAICARMAKVGLRFDLPNANREPAPSSGPGTNPDAPPRLR